MPAGSPRPSRLAAGEPAPSVVNGLAPFGAEISCWLGRGALDFPRSSPWIPGQECS